MKFTSLLALVLLPVTGFAFFGGSAKSSTDPSELLAQLFGKNDAFTATAVMTVKNRKGKETQAGEMQYAFLHGKLRVELDMTKTKAAAKRGETMNEMAEMGLDRMVTLTRPDKKTTYIIYPGMSAYCEAPKTVATRTDAVPKIERTELGKETIDGHPCVKSKVLITDADGKTSELTVWTATDLNDFPIKSEMADKDGTVGTHFKDIKLAKPDPALFELPANYTRYNSVQEMMMQSMQKMMQQMAE
jgi:outer membrane lipoprotein-sorting protein